MKLSLSSLVLFSNILFISASPVLVAEPEPVVKYVLDKRDYSDPWYPKWDKKCSTPKGIPFEFTSIFRVIATPDQVVNGTTPTPGQPGAVGIYQFGFNSVQDVACYVSYNTPIKNQLMPPKSDINMFLEHHPLWNHR